MSSVSGPRRWGMTCEARDDRPDRRRRGRSAAALAALLALLALTLLPAAALAEREHEEAGEESAELARALEWFGGQRLGPARAIAPGAFSAAAGYAAGVQPADATTAWTELGPYAYAKDDRRYL